MMANEVIQLHGMWPTRKSSHSRLSQNYDKESIFKMGNTLPRFGIYMRPIALVESHWRKPTQCRAFQPCIAHCTCTWERLTDMVACTYKRYDQPELISMLEIEFNHIPLLDLGSKNELSKNSSIALNFNRRSTCLWSFDFGNFPTTFPSCAFEHLGKRKLRHVQPQFRANKVGDTVPIRSQISFID